jgi:hypothetical protein
MVALGVGTFILAGVTSTFLMIGRVCANAGNYCDLDTNARQALEIFSREVRNACYVDPSFNTTSVKLGIPDMGPGPAAGTAVPIAYYVIYSVQPDPEFPGQNCLDRYGPPSTNIAAPLNTYGHTSLVHNVQSVTFNYYSLYGNGYFPGDLDYNPSLPGNVVAIGTSSEPIKQIELTLVAQRSSSTVTTATDTVISARFMLRNKS